MGQIQLCLLYTSRNGAAIVRQGAESLTFEFETKSGTIWLKDTETTDKEETE